MYIYIYMYIPCVYIYIEDTYLPIYDFFVAYSILFMSMNLDICIHTCYLSVCEIY